MRCGVLITVIVPIYKVEKYIRKCIDSILGQTYANLEIFLVDDGSPDNCGIICDEYAQRDERIIVIHKENGGLSSARNVAIDVAKGQYIMFVDSDDWVEPNFCEKSLEIALKMKVDIVAFGFENVFLDKKCDTKRVEKRFTKNARILDSSEAIRHLILRDDIILNFAWNKIYKRGLFEGIRYPQGFYFEDNAVTYKLINKARIIYVSDAVLYNYVIRKDSISGIWFNHKSIMDRYIIWKKRLEDVKVMCPENEEIQLLQVASEAVDGVMYLRKDSNCSEIVEEMRSFLSLHKKEILSNHAPMKLKIYYYARPILPMIKIFRYLRDLIQR